MIINDLYNNKKSSLSEGMKAQELAMYCEKLVAEKGWDRAYKHARFMAQGNTDPAWGSVLKYLQSMKDGVAEGSELKQAKRKYNQAAKDANLDQVGAGKKIDTMKKSLRQKDLGKEQGITEAHNAAAKEIHGNLFHDSIPPGAEKHHVSAVLKAHGLKDTDAKDVIDRVRKMGYTGSRLGKPETDEGRMVKGPGGVPLDRRGNPIVPKAKPLSMRKWIVIHDGSHGEGGKDIIEAPNAETAWETANEYDLNIISINPYRGPAGPTLVDEGWKSALGGAALAGSMALGGGAAQAQNAPSGENFLPAIVAHVTFKANGNTVTKDINLGTSFKSPGEASAALEKFLKSKGIKFYEFNLERVSDTEYNNNYLDNTPLSDKGNPAAYHTADKGYTPSNNTAGDYMVKEGPVTKKPQPGSDSDWWKKLPKDQLDALAGKRYPKDKKPTKPVSEVNLGDYRKKAALSKATSQMDRFFGRDDPATVSAADQNIAKRERGMARADARSKPYIPPKFDAEKYQRDLTAKYPNIDQLVADAERNRDPYYDRAEGSAYYRGREAEQLYQRLKQIQRVIQGLNESLDRSHLP